MCCVEGRNENSLYGVNIFLSLYASKTVEAETNADINRSGVPRLYGAQYEIIFRTDVSKRKSGKQILKLRQRNSSRSMLKNKKKRKRV